MAVARPTAPTLAVRADMAQRHEIEAWVNPSAWDDEDEAVRVIDAIEASGSEDEAEWSRIAELGAESDLAAAARDFDRATSDLDDAREKLHATMGQAHDEGMSAYRIAQVTGVTQQHVGRIVKPRANESKEK